MKLILLFKIDNKIIYMLHVSYMYFHFDISKLSSCYLVLHFLQ